MTTLRTQWRWIAGVIFIAVIFLLVSKRSPLPGQKISAREALMLAYPLRHGGWIKIRRELGDVPKTSEGLTRRIVKELMTEDSSPAVFTPLPETFPLRSVYFDGSQLYIDIANEGVAELSGGSEDEMIVLESLKQTLAWNLPSVEQFQILVDGVPRRTLGAVGEDAGHINILGPIRIKK